MDDQYETLPQSSGTRHTPHHTAGRHLHREQLKFQLENVNPRLCQASSVSLWIQRRRLQARSAETCGASRSSGSSIRTSGAPRGNDTDKKTNTFGVFAFPEELSAAGCLIPPWMSTTHPRDFTDRPQPPLSPLSWRALLGVFRWFRGPCGGTPRAAAVPPRHPLERAARRLKRTKYLWRWEWGGGKGDVGMEARRDRAGMGSGMRGTAARPGPARGPAMAAALRAGSCLETAGPRHGGGKG